MGGNAGTKKRAGKKRDEERKKGRTEGGRNAPPRLSKQAIKFRRAGGRNKQKRREEREKEPGWGRTNW